MTALQHGKITRREWIRFMNKVHIVPAKHWLWIGAKSKSRSGNYGTHKWRGRTYYAHRFAYIALRGNIPTNQVGDHLCEINLCVNPDCILPSTHRDNILRGNGSPANNARKICCKHGHPFDATNTIWETWQGRRHPRRVCRICLATRLLKKKQATS